MSLPEAYLVHATPDCAGGHDAMRGLLALEAPTAVFACNDLMALGGLCAAGEAGVAVPGRLSVVGGDDLGMAAFATPRLSSVTQPTHALGRQLTELLVGRIRGDTRPRMRRRLAGSLMVRQPTGRV